MIYFMIFVVIIIYTVFFRMVIFIMSILITHFDDSQMITLMTAMIISHSLPFLIAMKITMITVVMTTITFFK